ncbi:hypothetical protein [Sporocytophaga myxococcoides]|nr:hypothetical protein [Sporocytophaga myxococcoides]
MKNTFKTAIILILLSTMISEASPACHLGDYLSNNAPDTNKRSIKYGVGINLIPLSLLAISPTFDYYLRNSNSLSFAARVKQSLDFPIMGHSYEYIAANELAFSFDYKINFTKNNYLYYIAPGVFYKKRWFKEMWIGYENGSQYDSNQNLENMDLDVYGLRLLLGFRRLMTNTYLDFYLGPGFTYNHWNYQITDHYGGSSYTFIPQNYSDERNRLSFHIGLNFGFLGFRK